MSDKNRKVIGKEACPTCQAKGNDTSEDNLVRYADGHAYCYACGLLEGVLNDFIKSTDALKMPKFVQPASLPFKAIGLNTCSTWGIVEELDKRGNTTDNIVYPYYNEQKVLVGIKYRNFETQRVTGEKDIFYDGELEIFGLHIVSPAHTECIIWEGESDTLSGFQINAHYAHFGIPGAQTGKKLMKRHSMFFRQFKKVLICTHNDDEGENLRQDIVECLPQYMTYNVYVPPEFKDFNETLLKGKGQDCFRKMIQNATLVSSEDLITGKKLKSAYLAYVADGKMLGGFSTGFSVLDEMLGGGLHFGEFIILVGHTGRGKSTFVRDIAVNVLPELREGQKIMWVGTEMQPTAMLHKFVERKLGKRYTMRDGEFTISIEKVDAALDDLCEEIIFYNNLGGDYQRIEDAIIAAIHQHDVSVVFLDVLCDLSKDFSDWKTASSICQRLVTLAQGDPVDRRPPIVIFAVNHTKGDENEQVEIDDMRGGSAVRQKATLIVSFEGDIEDDTGIRTLRVLKRSRMHDAGEFTSSKVKFDTKTREYTEYTEDDEKPNRSSRRRILATDRRRKTVDVRASSCPPG